jgi:Tol biopolymer transport system component
LIGKSLAHYEVTALLGKGGMGEVYRANDTKLGREVALKLLPSELADDAERLARFRREARTLASLHHARIASLFGIEEIEGATILVMELVEGQDLSERLDTRGAFAVEDVISVAIQIAEGLEFAHDNGVMHRDLKPANIKITDQDEIKLLDFGLARAFTGEPTDESSLVHTPTITAALTQVGVILGTAAYMSPEQAKGRSVDRRADIWSYGAIIYELLVGRRLFQGESATETMAEVMKTEIEWESLPDDTPETLRRLLMRCLDRNPATRLRDIGEARIALEDLRAGRTNEAATPEAVPGARGLRRERLVWIVLLLAALAGIGALTLLRPGGSEQQMVQSTILPPPGWDFVASAPFAVSPAGLRVAYVAYSRPDNDKMASGTNSIWIRDLDSVEPRELTACDGDAYPFWSPDGRWIGYFGSGKLNKIESRGGPVIPLCEATNGRGGSWSQDGVIIFQPTWSAPLMKVAAGGGTPQPLTSLNAERVDIVHRWPTFLPDGRRFLYFVACTTNPAVDQNSGIYLGSLDSDESHMVLRSESRALYSQGHLIYRAGSTLMACPFDPAAGRLAGDPVSVATEIPGGAVSWGGAQFGVSDSGLLVHLRGARIMSTVLQWKDRDGNMLNTLGDPGGYWEPKLSHDGKRVAVAAGQDAGDIWIHDLQGNLQTRFSFDAADDRTPLWSPDDRHLVFNSAQESVGGIYLRPVSGQEPAKMVHDAQTQIALTDWSRDGRHVFFNHLVPDEGGWDIWALDMETFEATAVLASPDDQSDGSLSPDGKYLAFSSDESGQTQIYVQSFPEAAGRWMVSGDKVAGRATRPLWRGDGKELFYIRGSALMAVSVATDNGFSFGTPQYLFSLNLNSMNASYDPSQDGQQILTNEMPATNRDQVGARLIQNWSELLRR